jgi:hypothetical protein
MDGCTAGSGQLLTGQCSCTAPGTDEDATSGASRAWAGLPRAVADPTGRGAAKGFPVVLMWVPW